MQDFGERKLGLGSLVRVVLGTRITSSFLEAVPGFQDLCQLGKVENMIMEPLAGDPRYDTVILDAPATGHGLTLLAAARAMREMTGVGPFHDLAGIIEVFLADPTKTAIVPVTLPEELPVHETLELAEGLGVDRRTLGAVLVNQVVRAPLPDAGWDEVRAALGRQPAGAPWLGMAERVRETMASQEEVLEHLRSSLGAIVGPELPIIELPRLDPRVPTALVSPLAALLGGAA
jgi:anion-transporting  ArsA/GET3 family ATPase